MSANVDINEVMDRWRMGVKRKKRGLASFAERIELRLQTIADAMLPQRVPLDGWEKREGYYRGPGEYEWIDEAFRPVRIGDTWGREDSSALWRCTATVPEAFKGQRVLLRVFIGGDALLRVDGRPFHGLDWFHHEVPLLAKAKGGETLELEIESYIAWHAEKRFPHTFALSELATVDEEIERAYWDLKAAVKALDLDPMDSKLQEFLSTRIWEALKLVPLEAESSEAMREAILAAGARVRRDVYESDRFRGEGLMHLVGHSHLDIVFMWPYKEFIRKIGRTHATMLRMMEQYPEFTFSQSQAKLYADMKRYFPEMYEEVKRRVAEGRWELTGAFWVEPDCNLISGESFVRQILHGQKFFEAEFGRRAESCWQPDVFGLSWAMPQILARSGLKYFLTNKMVIWNDTNPWTRHTFWWEGMDGSRVLAIVPPGHFIGTVEPDIMDRQWRSFSDKAAVGETLHVYGWGDGGGGPDPEMVECGRRYADFPGLVPTRFATAEGAFARILEKAEATDQLPVLKDELYLEAHRGTFTNKGRLKKLNRRLELLYRAAEMLAAFAWVEGREYPAARLREGWEELLTSQFHDSLPGTHIPEVTVDMLRDYAAIRATGEGVQGDALGMLLGPPAATPKALVAVNTLAQSRCDLLSVPADLLGDEALADAEEGTLAQQRVTDLDGTERVLVNAGEVPGVGYRAFNVVEGGKTPDAGESGGFTVTERTLENALLRAELNDAGELVSLFDKEHGREVLAPGEAGNRFQLYEDMPGRYEAWDIAASYVDHPVPLGGKATLRVDETGPLRASLLLERSIAASTLRQRISLEAGSRMLTFETEIDWRERRRLLKVAFPVDVRSLAATYDIAFGNMERPTHRNDPVAAAKFEVPAHLWADLSQADYGVSLLNDCKYGHETHGHVMRLTLLKGSTYPDPMADVEVHHFTYVLYPHAGSWREAGTHARALELNEPVRLHAVAAPPGARAHRYLACTSEAVTLEAVKRSEDGKDLVVRLVERRGSRAEGRLVFDRRVRRAWRADLMETKEGPLEVEGGEVPFVARPYEILTVRVAF